MLAAYWFDFELEIEPFAAFASDLDPAIASSTGENAARYNSLHFFVELAYVFLKKKQVINTVENDGILSLVTGFTEAQLNNMPGAERKALQKTVRETIDFILSVAPVTGTLKDVQ